ncbi:MAG: DUF4147 domain-containing protein [Spirochaetota bacterium]
MNKDFLEELFFTAIASIQAKTIIKQNILVKGNFLYIAKEKYDLNKTGNLYLYGVGKAALQMAQVTEKILGKRIHGGLVISHQKGSLKHAEHFTSTHPIVSAKSILAAQKMKKEFAQHTKKDLLIFLLSGGASAMVEEPIGQLCLEDFTKISQALLTCGVDITALNTVRKSLSTTKGGKLAALTKASGAVLVLSDVVGDRFETIGSAPMLDKKFKHFIIGNNQIALKAMKQDLAKEDIVTKIITTTLQGSSQACADFIVKTVEDYKDQEELCLLFGGESVTKPKKGGQGGRNQELALRLFLTLPNKEDFWVLCAGSDGIDGNSPAAGAFLDPFLQEKIQQHGLDPNSYLQESNSYLFFSQLGYDFTTGATGTNVMDFVILIKSPKFKGN